MRSKKSSNYNLEELDKMISELVSRRGRMEARLAEMEAAIFALNRRLKGLYGKRTIALNFTLPLEETP